MTMISNAGNAVLYYRSADKGATWSYAGGWNFSVTIQEISALHITVSGDLWLAFRTHESNRDRISIIRAKGTATTFSYALPLKVADPANGGVPGSVHTGMDIGVVGFPNTGAAVVVVAVGTRAAGQTGLTLYGANQASNGTLTANNAVIAGKRQWMYPEPIAGGTTPQLDIEHGGDGKTAKIPHLWVCFGRNDLRVVKLAWNGSVWTGPTNTVLLMSGLYAPNAIAGRWDGGRFLMAVPNPVADATDVVLTIERNQANSTTVQRRSPAHPAGQVRNCTLAYNAVSGDFRVFAVGTDSNLVYYVDYIRASGLWSAWATANATPVLGGRNYSVRHESYGSARFDLITAHAGTPNTVQSTSLALSYAPNAPRWLYGTNATTPPANGAAMDVAQFLKLDWEFTDPDPNDSQTAWALSRQIGTAAIEYFRVSDGTWQPTEAKNTGGGTDANLGTTRWVGPGGAADPPHTYRAKVWDSTDIASLYSSALVVVPSAKVNPTITSPTPDGAIWTSDTVTMSWTVDEQTAYRIQLLDGSSAPVHDTGWLGGTATSYTIPAVVADGETYTIQLWTRNDEGLSSTLATRTITVDYVEPPLPTVTATPKPQLGLIQVVIATPAPTGPQPAVLSVELMRRHAGVDTSTDVTIATGLSDDATWDDWTARSGQPYEYRALTRGANGTTGYGPWTA